MLFHRINRRIPPLYALMIGNACLLVAIGLGRPGVEFAASDFVSGLLYGLSLAFNLFGLWMFGRERRQADKT